MGGLLFMLAAVLAAARRSDVPAVAAVGEAYVPPADRPPRASLLNRAIQAPAGQVRVPELGPAHAGLGARTHGQGSLVAPLPARSRPQPLVVRPRVPAAPKQPLPVLRVAPSAAPRPRLELGAKPGTTETPTKSPAPQPRALRQFFGGAPAQANDVARPAFAPKPVAALASDATRASSRATATPTALGPLIPRGLSAPIAPATFLVSQPPAIQPGRAKTAALVPPKPTVKVQTPARATVTVKSPLSVKQSPLLGGRR